jgi:hypothetical protein
MPRTRRKKIRSGVSKPKAAARLNKLSSGERKTLAAITMALQGKTRSRPR